MTQTNHWLNFIGGQWVDSATAISVDDPATGKIFATIANADASAVDQAVKAARACVDSGVLFDCRPVERAALMQRIAVEIRAISDEASPLLAQENGKALAEAEEEFLMAAKYFEYYAGMADKIEGTSIPLGKDYVDFTVYEPVGISAQIVPWNFPVDICARSLAPALAAGNAVVVKSPEISPLAMTWLATACARAGLPEGALSVLCGYGHEAGAALVAHKDIDQIVFTGSVATGQSILRTAAERAIPSVMELGGKSAAVAFSDADMDQLLSSVRWGIYYNAGQVCSAMSRLLVQRDIYNEVVEKVTELAQSLKLGAGSEGAELTPVASRRQQQQVLAMCDEAVTQGARLLTGGKAPERDGYFVEATVFADVTPEMTIFRDEVFGPVIAITPFDTEEEAWALANGTDFGLVSGVFTHDLTRTMRATRALKSGQVFVNEWYAGGVETPFGGLKLSGFGREKGQEALYSYVNTKNIAIRISK